MPSLRGIDQTVPLYSNLLLLDSWEERQAALVLLGHNIGSSGPKGNGVDGDPGYRTRAAIEALEEEFGFPVDGYWDDTFDYHVKVQLHLHGIGKDQIEDLF